MVRLILITLIASAFFSSTYILNELMSNSGGIGFGRQACVTYSRLLSLL